MKRILFPWLVVFWAAVSTACADVKLPAIFSEHAVLQRGEKVPVWGWAAAGEEITATLGGISANATTDASGKWRAVLNLAKAGDGPFDLVVKGRNEVKVPDVLVGQVWFCMGQSNMEMRLSTTMGSPTDDKSVLTGTRNPLLRHFMVERSSTGTVAEDVKGKWILAVPETVGDFTAVGFYFGQALQRELKVPVGLVHSSWGGSTAEAWMSREAFQGDAGIKTRWEDLQALLTKSPAAVPADDAPQADTGKGALPPNKSPSHLFNGMLAPVIPYAMTGVVWYQGESNVGSGQAPFYRKMLDLMVNDWRERWGQGEFSFYLCQLANYQVKRPAPGLTSTLAELREAMTQFAESPNAGQAILIDVGEEGTIHPRNKKDPGERLARIALARDYGQKVVYQGPMFQSAAVEGSTLRVKFSHVDGGLVARPLAATYQPKSIDPKTVPLVRNSPGSEVEGFIICGQDRKWAWAEAKIEGDTVVVSSPGVPQPVAARYAWENNPTCNLYNGAGLPAGPFRTDTFPGTVLPGTPPPKKL